MRISDWSSDVCSSDLTCITSMVWQLLSTQQVGIAVVDSDILAVCATRRCAQTEVWRTSSSGCEPVAAPRRSPQKHSLDHGPRHVHWCGYQRDAECKGRDRKSDV